MPNEKRHNLKQNILTIEALLSMLERGVSITSDSDGEEVLEDARSAAKQLHAFIDSIPQDSPLWTQTDSE